MVAIDQSLVDFFLFVQAGGEVESRCLIRSVYSFGVDRNDWFLRMETEFRITFEIQKDVAERVKNF